MDMPERFASLIVPPLWQVFSIHYPKVRWRISTSAYRRDLWREDIDCVVRVGHLPSSDLIARPLGHLTLGLVASRACLRQQGKPTDWAALEAYPRVGFCPALKEPESPWLQGVGQMVGQSVIEHRWPSALTVTSTDAQIVCALQGDGVAQVPLASVWQEMRDGHLEELLPQHRVLGLPAHLLYTHRELAPHVRACVQWLEPKIQVRLQAIEARLALDKPGSSSDTAL